MSRHEDDLIEAEQRAAADRAIAAEARTLAGADVVRLRVALSLALEAIGLVTVKSLPFATGRAIVIARQALEDAAPILGRKPDPTP